MSNNSKYLKELAQLQTQAGFKQKFISVPTGNGKLSMTLYGSGAFLSKMPALINVVARASYNSKMFAALANAKKPISVIYTKDRSLLGGGVIREALPWYKFLSVKEVKQLMLLFNTEGFHKPIAFECKRGDKIIKIKKPDDVKYTLTHEFFHLWQNIEPTKVPKIGILPRAMMSPDLQAECWATRYTNGWRYKEKRCIRYLYGRMSYEVDSIRNYK